MSRGVTSTADSLNLEEITTTVPAVITTATDMLYPGRNGDRDDHGRFMKKDRA